MRAGEWAGAWAFEGWGGECDVLEGCTGWLELVFAASRGSHIGGDSEVVLGAGVGCAFGPDELGGSALEVATADSGATGAVAELTELAGTTGTF